MKIIFYICLAFLLFSCGDDHGNRVVGDNFTVYFTYKKDQKLAEDIALYFKQNNLISNQKQDIQLTRVNNRFQIRLIATGSSEQVKNMSFEERKLLTELQTSLYQNVFNKPFDMVICNDKFEPIYTLNE